MLTKTKFNPKKFATYLRDQAEQYIPEDIANSKKELFLDTVYKFSLLTGESLSKHEDVDNTEYITLVTQLLSEWIFHKYVDLLRSDIPEAFHESILQKVAYTIFEVSKIAVDKKLSDEEICTLVENHVNKSFSSSCTQLLERNIITQETLDNTLKLENVNEMTIENNKNSEQKPTTYTSNWSYLAVVIGALTFLLNIYAPYFRYLKLLDTVVVILLVAYIGWYIWSTKKK